MAPAVDEEPFRPRPRLHVRVRRARRALSQVGPRLAVTGLAVLVTAFCFSRVIGSLGLARADGPGPGAALGAGFSATVWLVIGTGAAAMIPLALHYEPGEGVLKPGALRAEWRRLRARLSNPASNDD